MSPESPVSAGARRRRPPYAHARKGAPVEVPDGRPPNGRQPEGRSPSGNGVACSKEALSGRRAWWRGLYSFSGRATPPLSAEQGLELGAAPVVPSASSQPAAKEASKRRPSQPQEELGPPAVLQPLGDGLSSPPPTPYMPSPHLKWARHVRSVQGEWLRGQMAVRAPKRPAGMRTPISSYSTSSPEHSGLSQLCERKELQWVLALRNPDLEPEPVHWQEKKCLRARRKWRLQKLRSAHSKWLQEHSSDPPHGFERSVDEERARSRSSSAFSSCDAGDQSGSGSGSREGDNSPESPASPTLADTEASAERPSPLSLLLKPAPPQAEPTVVPLSRRSQTARGSSPASPTAAGTGRRSTRTRRGAGSLGSPRNARSLRGSGALGRAGERGGDAGGVGAGPGSASGPAAAQGADQGGEAARRGGTGASRSSKARGSGQTGGPPRPRSVQRPLIVVHNSNADEGKVGQRGRQRHEAQRRGSPSSDRSSSLGSSESGQDAADGGPEVATASTHSAGGPGQQSLLSCLENINKATYTPSFVESGSEVSSKRSSVQESRAKELAERLLIKEEEEGEDEDNADAVSSGIATPLMPHHHEFLPFGKQKSEKRSRSPSLESWHEWRTEFPLEVLNTFSETYSGAAPGVEESGRLMPGHAVAGCVAEALDITRGVVHDEMLARGLVAGGQTRLEEEVVPFSCFKDFLALARSTMERVEREQDQLLFTQEEMEHMKAVLNRFGGKGNSIAPVHLFDVMQRFNIGDINVQDPDQQRQIADTIQLHLKRRAHDVDHSERTWQSEGWGTASSSLRRSTVQNSGALSFPDILHITGMVVCRMRRDKRSEEFQRERRVRREAGFTPSEMEDLRELYNTYKTIDLHVLGHPVHTRLRTPGHKTTLARLMSLLVVCGIEDLSEREVNILEDTVSKNVPQSEGVAMPFDVFMLCMRDVFSHHIGNIQWRSSQEKKGEDGSDQESESPRQRLEGRTTFGSIMLLERARRERKRKEDRAAQILRQSLRGPGIFSGTSSAGNSRKSSVGFGGWSTWDKALQFFDASNSRKSSVGAVSVSEPPEIRFGSRDHSPTRVEPHPPPAASHSSSRPASRAASRHSSRPSSAHRSYGGASAAKARHGRADSGSSMRREPSVHCLGGGRSNARSRKTVTGPLVQHMNDEETARGSKESVANSHAHTESAASRHPSKEGVGSILKLKGLPAAEVMLGRKEFRACSVELEAEELEAARDLWSKDAAGTPPPPKPSPSSSAAPPAPGHAPSPPAPRPTTVAGAPGGGALGQPPQRRVKQGQDSLAVVNDAIAKLAERQEAEDSDDSSP